MISYSGQPSKQTQIQNESTTCQKAKQGGLISLLIQSFSGSHHGQRTYSSRSKVIISSRKKLIFLFIVFRKIDTKTTFRNQYLSAGVVSGIATVSIGEVFFPMKWRIVLGKSSQLAVLPSPSLLAATCVLSYYITCGCAFSDVS